MPVTTGDRATTEYAVYQYCRETLGFNVAVSCGVLANINSESGFRLEASGDNGTSYGLCQWHLARKNKLISFCETNGLSYNSARGQMSYLQYELEHSEKKTLNKLKEINEQGNSAQQAYDAGYQFCLLFERPAGGKTSAAKRGNSARDTFYPVYSADSSGGMSGTSYAGSYEQVTGNALTTLPETGAAVDYSAIQLSNQYTSLIRFNLSSASADGFDYGYLIDLEHSGTFRFYLPEFSESAGAQWESIDIPGRSSSILSYKNTSSRSITINLDLYAGEGLYKVAGESFADAVSRLHRDANFLKSLEYPDYTTAIVGPPPRVHLILGSAVNIEGVVESVNVEHKKPVDTQNRAIYLKIAFTVRQVADIPMDYTDIRGGSSSIISSSDTSSISSNQSNTLLTYTNSTVTASSESSLVDTDSSVQI